MAAFNSMPSSMPAGALVDAMHGNALGHHHHQQQHTHNQPPPDLSSMQRFDVEMNFEEALLYVTSNRSPILGSAAMLEEGNTDQGQCFASDGGALSHLPFNPTYDFDSLATFEDPFSYSVRAFEPRPNEDAILDESSPQQLDNKLLGFSGPALSATVVDDMGKVCDVGMTAELYGMFFVAEDVFGADSTGRPLELTCYRRNLWQCSGQMVLPRIFSHIVDDQGRQVPLMDLSATISGVESIEGKPTEIISIPWKNSAAQAAAAEEPKTAGPPPTISLDLAAGQELDPTRVVLPFIWKRLQFKHATANNGRRKGLQQHYIVHINLVANAKAGDPVTIAEVHSGPVIVRGRSPRNFDSRKDVPLTGEKRIERRNTTSSNDSTVIKSERDAPMNVQQQKPQSSSTVPHVNESATPQSFPQPSQNPHPSKRMAISPTVPKPPVPSWSRESPTKPTGSKTSGAAKGRATAKNNNNNNNSHSAPINLSLSEDERSPNRCSAEVVSPQNGRAGTTAVGRQAAAASSPTESEDPLYEYFPLSIDDWMPPVDAIYRPHVVHHTVIPPEIKAQQVHSRTKRYFLAD
ncbi:NDT80 / PhoG like DNA-binding family [Geosmithia morbida]|uniref:NDT80 / PhoG like DNA-binding family n=1 Tax=Geosmithia morbida TaxID=1094350 RepID=A0A9P5D6G9_9HYPO|nr:NDT80 / PhoG like DNA-binding family [Geosmithia morbida]KAF4125596.1 NDT80 / PhoG like DNA-binding family [Geosmithia morbida]